MSELHIKLPLTPKVGTIEDNKFASWSGTHGSYSLLPTGAPTFKTDKMLSGSFTFDEMVLNRTVCAKLSNKNKSLVEFTKNTNSALKKTLTKSNSMESFVHYQHYQRLLHEAGSYEQFKISFDKYRRVKPNTMNMDVISVFETDLVVKDCLGDDAPEFILYKVRELCHSVAKNNEVFWDDFW